MTLGLSPKTNLTNHDQHWQGDRLKEVQCPPVSGLSFRMSHLATCSNISNADDASHRVKFKRKFKRKDDDGGEALHLHKASLTN